MSVFSLPGIGSHISWLSPTVDDHVPTAASEIQELRSKLLYLESILEEKSNTLKQKHSQLEEKGQVVDKMELKIQSLKDAMTTFKNPQDGPEEERVNVLDKKVRLLWDESRKNNFKLHVLEEQAEDSEKKLEALSSRLQKAKDIVTEQCIQIQQLEQALLMAKMRAAKVRLKHDPQRWSIPQTIRDLFSLTLFQEHRPIFSGTYVSGTFYQLRKFFLCIQNYHFALQHSLKSVFESHGFTASLVHDEIIFFLVSATIVFPLLAMVHVLVILMR